MPSEKEIASLYHEDLEHFKPYIEQLSVHREYFRKKINDIRLMINDKSIKTASEKIVNHTSLIRYRLLDIGCAMGVLLEEAKKVGFRVQGIDISKDAVAYCRKKGLNVSQKWPKATFDVVTAFEIIEHERDPLGMMRRVHTLLNIGGIVVLTTPNHSSIWQKLMGKWWVGYRHPEHVTFWDVRSLTYLMGKAGFTNIDVRRDTPRPFPLSFMFTRGADYFPWAGRLLRPIGKLLDRFTIINPINPWDDLIVTARRV
jgi:SAM-dependent methyltransferase